MDLELKREFIELWGKYFGESELPFTFYYAEQKGSVELVKPPSGHQCFIGVLGKVRKGSWRLKDGAPFEKAKSQEKEELKPCSSSLKDSCSK